MAAARVHLHAAGYGYRSQYQRPPARPSDVWRGLAACHVSVRKSLGVPLITADPKQVTCRWCRRKLKSLIPS